jgi:DNA-binding PadR family transcriptional regulator
MTHRAAPSATEYTLLGLIAQEAAGEPVHGYDLQRRLGEGSLARIIRVEPGMMYHYLKKLARRGLITEAVMPQEGRPARHLHTVTREGRGLLHEWIISPVHSTREMRLEFLLKLWFARQDRDQALALIHAQARVIEGNIDSLRSQIDALPAEDTFGRAVLDLRLGQNAAIRSWLDDLETTL